MAISFGAAIILGIIQGITEWLPVSSSGHLGLVQTWFGIQAPLIFDILLHIGTLVVVLWVFRKDVYLTLKAFFTFDFKSEYGKLSLFIIIGTIFTAIIAILLRDQVSYLLHSSLAIGITLLVTGCILFITKYFKQKKELKLKHSILVGIAQGIGVIPGISRSGITISTGLIAGIKKDKIIRFSFLLSIPAILGAAILSSGDLASADISAGAIVVGLIVTIIVSYFTLKLLIKIIKASKFHYFAWYCWALGIVAIILGIVL